MRRQQMQYQQLKDGLDQISDGLDEDDDADSTGDAIDSAAQLAAGLNAAPDTAYR